MADVEKVQQTDDWYDLPWKQFQWNVYRLQRRIYQATRKVLMTTALTDEEPRVGKLASAVLHWRWGG